MAEGRRSDGLHLYAWNDGNIGSTGDGRIDEIEVTDQDNGTDIAGDLILPWIKPEDANLSAVEIVPSDQTGGQTPQVVDVAAAVREGRVRNMDRLKPGDTVRVPRALPGTLPSPGLTSGTSSSIFLFGAINRPGPIPADRQTDLMSAISQSGGPTPDANLSAVQIVRRTGTRAVHMKVNLSNYIDKAMVSGNPPLMAGDTVFLPRQGTKGFLAVVRTLSPILALASTVILIFRR